MPVNLSGKRMIVTGGATGIGRCVALRASVSGARVALFDVNDEEAMAAVNEINEAGGEARYWHVDVTDGAAVAGGVAAAETWLGGVDILVHLAGVLQGASVELDEFPEETWDTVLDINLRGSFLVAKSVTAIMKRQRNGVMVLASSGAGVLGGSSSFAYGSSKGGVHGLTLVMQNALQRHGIRVNDILPGSVRTPLKVAQLTRTYEITGDKQAYDRAIADLTPPDEIAKVVVFMVSDEANSLRGSVRTS